MADSRIRTIHIKAVLLQEGEWWSAQCLEHNVAAQARSLPELHKELRRVIASHVAISLQLGREPFANLKPADQHFWDLFAASQMRLEVDRPTAAQTAEDATEIYPQLRIAA